MGPNIGSQPGNVLSLTYNQAGERIKKHSDTNGTLYYIRGVDGQVVALLDENDNPLFYNIADVGRFVPGTNGSSYYYLTDHLGSIRVIVDESGNVVGYTDYYPFGMAMPGRVMSNLSNDFYKYNAKQLDDDYGLNWHDYGWRPYDAEIGRWVRVDPLAEKYPSLSAYVFVANNPLNLIDPNGEYITSIRTEDEEGNITYRIIYTASLINESSLNLTKEQLNALANQITEQLKKSFSGEETTSEGTTISWSIDVDINTDGSIREDDNVIYLVDPSSERLGDPSTWGKSSGGSHGGIGGRAFAVSTKTLKYKEYFQRTAAHEFGHNIGLYHPKSPRETERIRELTLSDPTNLMHQVRDITNRMSSIWSKENYRLIQRATNIIREQIQAAHTRINFYYPKK
ncbi:MAG: hypothetical protein D6732_00495 [Methanobacteriota archaeon]|nr:MAG: hypothetical protein D6732_00495 [Euryarchaeota archaeon]